ncbi:MAG: DNA gyrase inhibitor YacG [Bdellovibrio sp.]
MKNLVVKCPYCKTEFEYQSSQFRPFCSEKCRMIDLGMWLTENYKVPSDQPLSESDLEVVINEQMAQESDDE